MLIFGPLGFATPWILIGLAALPVLWLILRALPPSPRLVNFPATRLLLGLKDAHPAAKRTPWWLLLIRVLAIAALILAFAGTIWKPAATPPGKGTLLVVVDAGWAAAPDWNETQTRAARELEEAASQGFPAALLLADGKTEGVIPFSAGADLAARIRAAQPQAWDTRYPPDPDAALAETPTGDFRTIWFSDGLEHPDRGKWLTALSAKGPVSVVPPEQPVTSLALDPANDTPQLILRRSAAIDPPAIRAIGTDPQGAPRELARLEAKAGDSEGGITTWKLPIELPSELRNRITRFEVAGMATAGSVLLADDRVRRHKVALVGDDRATEGQALLSPMHYLREALAPSTDLIEGNLADVLQAAPDVIILVDQIKLPGMDQLDEWVHQGGLLVRFAGPRMAASTTLPDESMLPVRLRPGGRDVGGALSWGEPRGIAPFDVNGLFAGLAIPKDVTVRAQILPEPSPDLDARTIARLSDQTPLVTREAVGEGQVVLFHTTANAAWSNLSLSGLFVGMLDRLVKSARAPERKGDAEGAEKPFWTPEALLNGYGQSVEPGDLAPVAAKDFAEGPSPIAPAGTYVAGERRTALNAGGPLHLADWTGAVIEARSELPGLPLTGFLLAAAAALFVIDAFGSALLSQGRRRREMA